VKAGSTEILNINWYITDICNYKCLYCYTDNKNSKQCNYKLVMKRLNYIDQKFKINILGGEPTLHNNLLDIVKILQNNENCIKINIITNFSKPIKYFDKLIKFSKVIFSVSYHPQYTDNSFKNKITYFKNKIIMIMNVIDSKDFFEFFGFIKQNNIQYELNYLNSTNNFIVKYSKDFLDKIQKIDNITIKHWDKDGKLYDIPEIDCYNISYYNWKCFPKTIKIDVNGNFRMLCASKDLDLLLKNINEPIICPYEFCDACKGFHHEKYIS